MSNSAAYGEQCILAVVVIVCGSGLVFALLPVVATQTYLG